MPIPTQFERKPGTFHGSWSFNLTLASITAAGDVITNFTPGFSGSIKKWYFIINVVASTAGKAATLNLEINAVNVETPAAGTNSTVALTTAACDTIGEVVAGSAIGLQNTFDKDDTISVEASSVTAFSQGQGILVIEYEGPIKSGGGRDSRFDDTPSTFHGSWCLFRTLSNITDADVITGWTPGFPGRIKKWYAVFGGGTPGAGKATTLNLEIGAVNISTTTPGTNSTIALTTANCTTLGAVTDGSVIGAGNNFDSDDTISIEATSTTAFTGGITTIVIEYEGKVIGGAIPTATNLQVAPNTFHGSWCLPMYAPAFANGDIVTNFTPGFPGRIKKMWWAQDAAMAAVGGETTTLNLEVGAVNLTGGTIVIASATLTTKGQVQAAASLITGGNNFDSDDTISVEAASTTTHIDTVYGTLVIEYEGKVL